MHRHRRRGPAPTQRRQRGARSRATTTFFFSSRQNDHHRRTGLESHPACFDAGVTSPVPAARGERWFDGVNELARRLVANLELVVHDKAEEIRLVLAALIAGGH